MSELSLPHLSTRAKNVLRNLFGTGVDLNRPAFIAQLSVEDLRQAKGCGHVTFREIAAWLEAHGLQLAGSEEAEKISEQQRATLH
jgi:hypothetical protein